MHKRPLTQEDLEAMRARCESAFAEPVAIVNLGQDQVAICYSSDSARGSKVMPLAKYYGPNKIANAKFAAQAREDMLRLLAEVDRLQELVSLMREVEKLRVLLKDRACLATELQCPTQV